RMRRAVLLGQRQSANQKGGRERIGHCRLVGDDADAQDAAGRPTGPRIDHMAVAHAVDLDELLARTARGERDGARTVVSGFSRTLGPTAQSQARKPAAATLARFYVDGPGIMLAA